MNGRQAKRLRRAAMGVAVTLSEAGKDIKKDGYVTVEHSNRLSASSVIGEFDPNGVLSKKEFEDPNVKFEVPPSFQVMLRKDSVKAIYRNFKRGKA